MKTSLRIAALAVAGLVVSAAPRAPSVPVASADAPVALEAKGRPVVDAEPAVISALAVAPANPGINPRFRAVEVTGKVMLGGNACVAQGATAEMGLVVKGEDAFLTAYVRPGPDDGRICTMIYDPVYAVVTTTVRVDATVVRTLHVENVDEPGNTVRVHDFR